MFSLVWRKSRPTRDGTAGPVSRDHILRREREQENIYFSCSADHGRRIENLTRLIYNLIFYVMTIHTYKYH